MTALVVFIVVSVVCVVISADSVFSWRRWFVHNALIRLSGGVGLYINTANMIPNMQYYYREAMVVIVITQTCCFMLSIPTVGIEWVVTGFITNVLLQTTALTLLFAGFGCCYLWHLTYRLASNSRLGFVGKVWLVCVCSFVWFLSYTGLWYFVFLVELIVVKSALSYALWAVRAPIGAGGVFFFGGIALCLSR